MRGTLKIIKNWGWFKRLMKIPFYVRMRQRIPINRGCIYTDDAEIVAVSAPPVLLDWPPESNKPRIGIVRDYGSAPWWTKYVRFLKINDIDFEFFNIHASNWLDQAKGFQLVLGSASSNQYHLEEARRKNFILEKHMGIRCYPSFEETLLYEDKMMEEYLSRLYDFPFASTFITHDKQEALAAIQEMRFPRVSKIVPGSGSVGVELVRSAKECRRIIRRAFSTGGRKTHYLYYRQKNNVYLQEYVPNDGCDLRIIVIGENVFGYSRRVLKNDFRASGMHLEEWGPLPLQAMKLARSMNKHLCSPMLVVDMLRTFEGTYKVIEISPQCSVLVDEEVKIDGEPGRYVFDDDDSFRFERGKVWMPELVLKEVLEQYFLHKGDGLRFDSRKSPCKKFN
jgi:hypothetical protein